MAKLSDFQTNNARRSDGANQTYSNQNANSNFGRRASEEELRREFDTYKDMSKDELNAQLLNEVSRQKANGTFDYNALSSMVESMRGALPEQDYNNIKRILESLR